MTKGKWFAFIAVLMLGLMMIPNVVEAEIASGAGWELMDDGTLLIHSNITISGIYKTPWNSHSNEIKQVKIDDGVNYIGNYAFYFCKSLSDVSIPNSVISIGEHAFNSCTSLTHVSIPDSVTSIGASAFSSCTALTSISILSSIATIQKSTFSSCTSLSSVSIPNSVTSIEDFAFSSCRSLTSIAIPTSITSLKEYVFSGCSSLTGISIPSTVTTIGRGAFNSCSGLTYVYIPNSVITIGEYAFASCRNLVSISIPDSVTSIGDYAFSHCSSLVNVSLSNSLTGIANYVFYSCTSLPSITLPDSIRVIASCAFHSCSNLSSITLPVSVIRIWDSAFNYCNKLSNVYYSGNHYDRTKITVDSKNSYLLNTTWHYRSYGSCGKNLSYTISEDGYLSISGSGAMYEYAKTAHPWDESLVKTVTVGQNVSKLTRYAFYGSNALEKIYFEGYTCEFGTNLLSSIPTIYCYQFSDADFWAQENNLPIVYLDDADFTDYAFLRAYALTDDKTPVTSITLLCDMQIQLFASVFPNVSKIQWTSSNANVAAVDENGLVTALGIGDAVVTATVEDMTSEVSIHVTRYSDIGNATIKDAPASLKCGASFALNAVVAPAYDSLIYQWYSSNDKVLSVNENGIITAHRHGTATITVNVDGVTASVTITVYEPLTSLALSEAWGTITSLTAIRWTCEPANADTMLHWTAEMPSQASSKVSITDDGVLTSSALGDVIVTVTDDISGITATTTVHILAPVKAISVPEVQTIDACVGEYQLEAAVTTRRNDTLVNKLVTFSTNQPDVAEVDENGLITVKASGTANITVTAESGVSAVFTLNVNPAHTHRTKHPFSTGTCLTCGNTAYESCDSCGHYFVVNNGNLAEIANGSWYIKGWHHYENGTCKDCGKHFDWSGLNTLTLPAAIKEVEPEAFMNVSTQVIIVPNGCVTIGSRAFANCTNLRYVILPSTLETLADDAFAGCGSNVEFIWQ